MSTNPVLPAEDPMYPSSDGLPTGQYLHNNLAEAEARIAELEALLGER